MHEVTFTFVDFVERLTGKPPKPKTYHFEISQALLLSSNILPNHEKVENVDTTADRLGTKVVSERPLLLIYIAST